MILNIIKYPDPILRKKSIPVAQVNREIQELIANMFETMYDAPGVGLAAPQVAISKRLLVIDVGQLEPAKGGASEKNHKPDPKAIINPVIKTREEKIVWEEGCLSLPQLIVPVERSKKIVVEGLDQNGKPVKYIAEDLQAVAFQHEIDHLDGILLVDRISRLKRDLYLKKLQKIKNHEPVEKEEIEHGRGPAYIG